MNKFDTVYHVCAKIRELESMTESGAIRGFSITRSDGGYVVEIELHGLPSYDIAIKEVPGLAQVIFGDHQSGALFSTGTEGFFEGEKGDFKCTIKL